MATIIFDNFFNSQGHLPQSFRCLPTRTAMSHAQIERLLARLDIIHVILYCYKQVILIGSFSGEIAMNKHLTLFPHDSPAQTASHQRQANGWKS
jgi:hypothetical protein